MLRMLAGPVRQLADLRSPPPPREKLAAAYGCQHHLEHQAVQLPDHSDERRTAQHLTRLASEMIREAAGHQGTRDKPRRLAETSRRDASC